ncbi:terminase small subunit [Luteolibacter sp. GHJ8]|uniref:Terminase small subunit n=1 Tax=Luteolibacter rhizosphaerae TaxID=2989719 RepID=A0ABT3FXY6_9BACT|nr:terminase small subunit [Luteolibacter rhizosphaerae]MCW1912435.1 terminase small subunit [Luteolibacter rhizosphaerae]
MDDQPTRSQKPRPISPRQLQFARLVADGTTQTAAYFQVYGKKSSKADASALAHHPNVAAEIARRQREAEARADFKREDMIRYLVSILHTPMNELSDAHPLVQELNITRRGDADFIRIKGLAKLEAARLLSQIMGWLKPAPEPTTPEEPVTIVLKKMWD